MAATAGLPVVIHAREADDDIVAVASGRAGGHGRPPFLFQRPGATSGGTRRRVVLLVQRHGDVQVVDAGRYRPVGADRPPADRDRRALAGAGAAPRPAQRIVPAAGRGRSRRGTPRDEFCRDRRRHDSQRPPRVLARPAGTGPVAGTFTDRGRMKFVTSAEAPQAIGPYSQGVVAGGLLFTAGQIPLDPATMQIVEGDIAAQTERVMQNLAAVLAGAGLTMDRVVKTTVFLQHMADFAAMNEVYCAALRHPSTGPVDGRGGRAAARRAGRDRAGRRPRRLTVAPGREKPGDVSSLVIRPVFKTALEAPSAAPVGSIPIRSRGVTAWVWRLDPPPLSRCARCLQCFCCAVRR